MSVGRVVFLDHTDVSACPSILAIRGKRRTRCVLVLLRAFL